MKVFVICIASIAILGCTLVGLHVRNSSKEPNLRTFGDCDAASESKVFKITGQNEQEEEINNIKALRSCVAIAAFSAGNSEAFQSWLSQHSSRFPQRSVTVDDLARVSASLNSEVDFSNRPDFFNRRTLQVWVEFDENTNKPLEVNVDFVRGP